MARHSWLTVLMVCLALAALTGASSAGGIHITKAEYGAMGQWRDCTQKLQAQCDGGAACAVAVNNDICGDAYPGVGKSLVITYECPDGRNQKVQAEEGGILNLRCTASAGRSEALNIISAGYGASGGWVDATDKLRASCQGRVSCSVQAGNKYIGQDPAPGRRKEMVVEYQCGNGPRQSERVRENQWLKLGCEDLALPARELYVVEARYGSQGRYNDATQSVRSLCRGQERCSVLASNDLVGDPNPGSAKELIITYNCGGEQFIAKAREGRWVDLNCRTGGSGSGSSDGSNSVYQPGSTGSSGGGWSSGSTSGSSPSGPSSGSGNYTSGGGGG